MTPMLSPDDIEPALAGDGLTVRRQVDDAGTTELCVAAEDALPVLLRLDSSRHVETCFCACPFEDTDDLALWCDHQQAFGTTLPADALLQTYRTFARVCFSVPDFDEAGLLAE